MRSRIVIFVAIVQAILLLVHWFIYRTWTVFWGPLEEPAQSALAIALEAMSLTFVPATLLAHRYFNSLVRALYRAASIWLGVLNFSFVAAAACWIAALLARVLRLPVQRPAIAATLFGLALLASIYGMINAASIRVSRITVKLPGLPASWRGRAAALVSDTHLGHIVGQEFMSRIVAMLRHLRADVIFITGDLFDGTNVDTRRLAAPWKHISPRFGSFFVSGNHEEFSDSAKYLDAVRESGVRVLHNEKVNLDGLQVVGVPYHDSTDPKRLQAVLENASLDPERPSVLLAHSPHALPVAERQGISLQLSGHTHGGQIFPFTWLTSRVFGDFTYGLKRFGKLLVYTSSGAGTWGPPMRVGTRPEVVLIRFE